ncbi:MAG: tRNA (adenosine(37)-N6)-threonylcarbamoyltransferase complex transferase subunit TsaD [Oscillospiraceae bacterium]|jgi:N6-L-threonylcarbamoyladenine synthase|nr:tRNA (adenosine(37)-N6)-threonylcarbamoyltransferase complex transferase subunit TsaD [Oscillospiraceae bacterium]
MKLLAIESSCDDASAAIVEQNNKILAVKNFSQGQELAKFGGVVPEIASRRHVSLVFKAVKEVFEESATNFDEIKLIAATFEPGLIGPLLVGLNFAKGFAIAKKVPLIAVNHLKAHVAANYIENPELKPPFLCLVVSGGHTNIIDIRSFTDFRIIGQTKDDATGEIFDKIARRMGIPYPGGAVIDELAEKGNYKSFNVPCPEMPGFDFSFSGIKTWAINQIEKFSIEINKNKKLAEDLAASLRYTIITYIIKNLMSAARKYNKNKIAIAGGVASNSLLRKNLKVACDNANIKFFCPSKFYCTDNAAMVGVQAFYEFEAKNIASLNINARATGEKML